MDTETVAPVSYTIHYNHKLSNNIILRVFILSIILFSYLLIVLFAIHTSGKQGFDRDSSEAQRERGEVYAKACNIVITETIILLGSASHEDQPVKRLSTFAGTRARASASR